MLCQILDTLQDVASQKMFALLNWPFLQEQIARINQDIAAKQDCYGKTKINLTEMKGRASSWLEESVGILEWKSGSDKSLFRQLHQLNKNMSKET